MNLIDQYKESLPFFKKTRDLEEHILNISFFIIKTCRILTTNKSESKAVNDFCEYIVSRFVAHQVKFFDEGSSDEFYIIHIYHNASDYKVELYNKYFEIKFPVKYLQYKEFAFGSDIQKHISDGWKLEFLDIIMNVLIRENDNVQNKKQEIKDRKEKEEKLLYEELKKKYG